MEYSITPADDLIMFWRSKVKSRGHSSMSRLRTHTFRRWGVQVLLA